MSWPRTDPTKGSAPRSCGVLGSVLSHKHVGALAAAAAALTFGGPAWGEIELVNSDDWAVTTDGRVNAFVSHILGENRPDGLESLLWVGYNEIGNGGQADEDNKLRRTRIRGGFVPSTLAFNFRKHGDDNFRLAARTEVGFQITNMQPSAPPPDGTWMEPRAVYLDVSGNWGGVRAGRDMALFSRGNLFMNYELGHAYGVGFPCAFELIYGGACGHVGFGTLWPDYRAQITYSTPKFADIAQVSVGIFDPRTLQTYSWIRTEMPRFEGEAVADYRFMDGWGFKVWANGAFQRIGIGVDQRDPMTNVVLGRDEYSQDAYGVGGGLQGYLGPVKVGAAGYTGKSMDGFSFLTFNPIAVGQASSITTNGMMDPVENQDRRFRPTVGFLAEAQLTIGDTSIMGGYGKASFDRIATDVPLDTVDGLPLLRSQTGISAGVFHRIDSVVLGLDYFNASYGFDPQLASQDDGTPPRYIDISQNVNFVNAGLTLEW